VISSIIDNFRASANVHALMVMQSWVDIKVREDEGSNRGSVVDAIHEIGYGDDEDAAPWCARAIQAAWRTAGWATRQHVDPRISKSGSVFYLLHTTWGRLPSAVLRCDHIGPDTPDDVVDAFCARLTAGDALIRYSVRPEHADVAFDDLTRKMTHKGHAEMVERSYTDGSGDVDTIAGNTIHRQEREGNGVFRHERLYSVRDANVVGFVRPVFHPLG